jgi:uncharacterized protein
MKKILALVVFGAFCVPVFCQNSAKDAKIGQLLVSMNLDKQMDVVFTQMKAMFASQLPKDATDEQKAKFSEVQGKILDLVKSRMSWEKMRPQYVKLYSETFTDEEIDGLVTFYESPAGKAMLEKMPVLMTKSMAMAQEVMKEIMPQAQQMMKDALASK